MSKAPKATVVIVFAIMLLAVTAIVLGHHRWNRRAFSTLGPVTSVTVVGLGGSKQLVKITEQQVVFQIVTFVDSRRTGWETPWYGIPVPTVRVEFFNGAQFKGSFGSGADFFETHRDGVFCSQSASPSEVRRFLDLLGVDGDGRPTSR
ncbi:MAG: hypothetical protein WA690_10960 [Candidatus Acidiferrales bacterium]